MLCCDGCWWIDRGCAGSALLFSARCWRCSCGAEAAARLRLVEGHFVLTDSRPHPVITSRCVSKASLGRTWTQHLPLQMCAQPCRAHNIDPFGLCSVSRMTPLMSSTAV